jgi:hypothetical protein
MRRPGTGPGLSRVHDQPASIIPACGSAPRRSRAAARDWPVVPFPSGVRYPGVTAHSRTETSASRHRPRSHPAAHAPADAHAGADAPAVKENARGGASNANRPQRWVIPPPGEGLRSKYQSSEIPRVSVRLRRRSPSMAAPAPRGMLPNAPQALPSAPCRTNTPRSPGSGMRTAPVRAAPREASSTSDVRSRKTSLEAENPSGSETRRSIPRPTRGPAWSHGEEAPAVVSPPSRRALISSSPHRSPTRRSEPCGQV